MTEITTDEIPAEIQHAMTVFDTGEITEARTSTGTASGNTYISIIVRGHVSVKPVRLDTWELFSFSQFTQGGQAEITFVLRD